MNLRRRRVWLSFSVAIVIACAFSPALGFGQTVDPSYYSGLRWRMIGPFRGGRSNAVSGVPGEPSHFYFGSVGGGLWESTNAGETWKPIFDDQDVQSIGAIGVAPSDTKVIYVGTGEADMRSQISFGNGMYKSSDAGKTWKHIGLEDTRQIGRVIVDPHDANLVYVAALGHAYGPNDQRGVFRSRDGGTTWEKVLYKDANTGAIDLSFDPRDSRIIYAAMWATRRPPWTIYPPSNGPGGGVYKSTDGGNTWNQLTNGLPSEGVGRIGVAVAPNDSNRVYAIVDAKAGGIYRSDDAGATWYLMDNEARIWGRGWYFCNVVVDPKNPDKVYVSNTSTYRSDDGGKSFNAIKGAPGGDDYHQLWVYPDDGNRMILASDQGTEVSVDGGATWSSWYNQPTAEIYHIVTDNNDPYWVYGAQQDSGAVGVETRSVQGSITYLRGWSPICAGGESGYVAVDPDDSNVLYGGTVSTCNTETNVGHNISPMLGSSELGPFRHTWTLPVVFSRAPGHALYFSNQYLWKTIDKGRNWMRISGDLTRENPGVPANLDLATAADGSGGPRRGVIYTIAPSPIAADTIWTGTDDGYIQLTRDGGKTWKNVTPSELTPWSKVTLMDASQFDGNEAYAAVDRHRLEDYRPYIYRTRDAGKTWKLITDGIADRHYVNAIKADPKQKGVLFAGTELGVYVSFDDGDHWQSLQLNLPRTSARDFAIHGDDLIVATHGRGFWVLDNISALRQLSAKQSNTPAMLFKPVDAIRMRTGGGGGTPLPFGSPEAENPPTGAIFDYWLKADASAPITLEIFDASGKSVRKYSSDDRAVRPDPRTQEIPEYWLRTPEVLSARAGMHRWVWDLHYAPPAGGAGGGRGGGAGRGGAGGLWVMPGAYTAKLTADGTTYTQPVNVKMNTRDKVSPVALKAQYDLAQQIQAKQAELNRARGEVAALKQQVNSLRGAAKSMPPQFMSALESLSKKADEIGGVTATPNPDSSGVAEPSSDLSSFQFLSGELGQVYGAVEDADETPSAQVIRAWAATQKTLAATMAKWNAVKTTDLPATNAQIKANSLPEIDLSRAAAPAGRGGRRGGQ